MQRLLIIGSLPETSGIGGVTIHVSRLLELLDERKIMYSFIDYRTASIFSILKSILRNKVIHLHATNSYFKFLCALYCYIFRKKIILTFHGNVRSYKGFDMLLNQFAIRMASVPIFINNNSMTLGQKMNKNSKLFSAFIPPYKTEVLDKELLTLVHDMKNEYKYLFSVNAFNYALDDNGNEIYGIEFLFPIFKQYSEYVLLVSDPSGGYREHFSKNHISLPSNVKLISKPHPLYQLLKQVDVFLRPTSTDGDSLSVKEALFLGIPVICSDVVDRPLGVIVYHMGDEDDLKRQINRSLSLNRKNHIQLQNGGEQLIELYKSLNLS